ncbi:AAA family ATPase [Herbaspirillum sp. GCM10030257]|uniref:AAA family ATPase n=1 Tax=Herbaspirillum sp. GCM10030257 TaxID=3273393 RepID=UPI00360EF5F5
MQPDEYRALASSHPLKRRQYTLPTPMLEAAYDLIRTRVNARRPGIVLYATPQIGKSSCSRDVARCLKLEFPDSYTARVEARGGKRTDNGHMYRLILEAERHVLSDRKNSNDLFMNAVFDIATKVNKLGGGQYVLILDEAQTLTQVDLQCLVYFNNALAERGIRMTTVSFAQPEILHRITAFGRSGAYQIIARFLCDTVQFHGCADNEQLRTILNQYDELSEFPENSGISFTCFYLPIAFKYGFRLSTYANAIWTCIDTVLRKGDLFTVPMQHLSIIIEELLQNAQTQDCSSFKLTEEEINASVLTSGLLNFTAASCSTL